MTDQRSRDVDRRLREAFEPGLDAVARVVAAASSRMVRRRRRLARLVWAAAALVAIVAGAAAYRAAWRPPAAAGAETLRLTGSFEDDVLVVSAPDGTISVSGPGPRDERPPDGSGIVLVEGEPE